MALVRCPKHGIPYQADNPRGCPACALEKGGDERAQVMRELARASQAVRRPTGTGAAVPTAPPVEPAPRRSERWPAPVTTQPRPPVAEPGTLERLQELARRRPVPTVGIPLIVILLWLILARSGPVYVAQPSPVPMTGEVL